MKKLFCGIFSATALLLAGLSAPAYAGEALVGVWQHDAEILGLGGKKGKETSTSVSAEYQFDSPKWLAWALKPQPYVGGTVNLNGNTSFVGAGLSWRQGFSDRFYGRYALGISAHDGTREVPSPNNETDPVVIADLVNRKATEIEFGSSVLFRNSFAIGYQVSDDIGVELIWEHLSHAKLFDDVNEGIDNLGVRASKRF
ncbi:MAG: acyloxyacyl hydrolase [Alphaproteobacteria bacterium]